MILTGDIGGVYLGESTPFKILPKLNDETFVKRFVQMGRLSNLIKGNPIYLINNNKAALKGASRITLDLIVS